MKPSTKTIYRAKERIRQHLPYLSALIYGMPCRESTDAATFQVDSYGRCQFSVDFLNRLQPEQVSYCIVHEGFHIALNHHKRLLAWRPNPTDRERLIWNIACDLCIYQSLHRHIKDWEIAGIVCPDFDVMPGLMIREIRGWVPNSTSERYADWLNANVPNPNPPPFGGSCADGEPRPGENPNPGVAIDGKIAQVAAAVEQMEAAKPGSTPGGLKRALDKRLGKIADPFKVLESLVSKSVASPLGQDEFTYTKISRRQPANVMRRPGITRYAPECTVVVDTSGSMNGYVERATAAVAKGLQRVHRPRVICWDADVQSDKRVASLSQFSWDGGGGTSMDEAVTYADKKKADCIVCITDGETDWPAVRTKARLVIALVKKSGYATPDWAKVVRCYEGADYEA